MGPTQNGKTSLRRPKLPTKEVKRLMMMMMMMMMAHLLEQGSYSAMTRAAGPFRDGSITSRRQGMGAS
jgi:peptidoglycan biosynthesis protein MviN/MurJ (putative lipid II flippase)